MYVFEFSLMHVVHGIFPKPSLASMRASYSAFKRSDSKNTNIGWPFSEHPIAVQCWRGRGAKMLKRTSSQFASYSRQIDR